ncbi:uncharacterized protein N7496_007955 [Penicillium cataractarum]|uniref:DEUBAD domain-containing protein n=1 Tax=Penicillium cataractarum TaxID=2100454 RepID=A0A9W9RXN9_9EURO|nr:uncharacterized protein N7496_007955 [Penicillium cataractarum]KAJ5368195.1 hypothetical protein N7496_007955 [Penicillium cataractarum]
MSSPASSPASSAPSPPKRTPRKAAPRGKWSEEQLLTSDESVLIDADLVKILARPETWDILEEDEKREILALLPADTHPASELPPDDIDAKIPPLPDSFVRYSNNWRDGIRQFQIDLQNGRFDPEWLRQAETARRKREKGDFDSFKEREFEKFWGQKQRTDMSVMSGESSKIKLTQLIEAGVFLVGDIWRFGYVWGKGPDRVTIDKEVRIHEIKGQKLSFVVPTGQRVFLHSHAVTKERKADSLQYNDYDMDIPQKTESSVNEASESKPKEEFCATDNLQIEELQPMEGLQETNTTLKLEEPVPETKQEDPTDGEALRVPAKPEAKTHNENGSVQVVIVSPRHNLTTAEQGFKRPALLPAVEPPAKRKRGRPRKRPPSPVPEVEPEAETLPEPGPGLDIEPERESRVQVIIGARNSRLPRKEILSQIPIPPPVPVTAPVSSTNHDAMELTEPKPKPDGPEAMSSPLSPAQSISLSSPLSEPPEGFINDFTDERIEEPVIEPTEELVDEPNEEPTEETTGEHIEQPVEEPIVRTAEEPIETPVEQPAEKLIEEPTQPPSEVQTTSDEPLEIILPNISTPMVLVREILKIDGRKADSRTSNSWKEIRCYRKNQDMGSLFDVRLAWFSKRK